MNQHVGFQSEDMQVTSKGNDDSIEVAVGVKHTSQDEHNQGQRSEETPTPVLIVKPGLEQRDDDVRSHVPDEDLD